MLHFHLPDLLENAIEECLLLGEKLIGHLLDKRLRNWLAHLFVLHFLVDFGVLLLDACDVISVTGPLVERHEVLLLDHVEVVEHHLFEFFVVLFHVELFAFQDFMILLLLFLDARIVLTETLADCLLRLFQVRDPRIKIVLPNNVLTVFAPLIQNHVEIDEKIALVKSILG